MLQSYSILRQIIPPNADSQCSANLKRLKASETIKKLSITVTFHADRRLPVSDTSKHGHGAGCLLVCFKFSSLIFHTFILPTPLPSRRRRFLSILKEWEKERKSERGEERENGERWRRGKRERNWERNEEG